MQSLLSLHSTLLSRYGDIFQTIFPGNEFNPVFITWLTVSHSTPPTATTTTVATMSDRTNGTTEPPILDWKTSTDEQLIPIDILVLNYLQHL